MYPQAIYHLLFCIKYEPEDVYAVNRLGRTFLDAGLHEKALETFQQVLDTLDSNDAYAFYGLAETYEALRNYEAALVNYQKIRAVAGNNKVLLDRAEEKIKKIKSGR